MKKRMKNGRESMKGKGELPKESKYKHKDGFNYINPQNG